MSENKLPTYLSAVAAIPEASPKATDDSVKIATPDLILENSDVLDIEIMTDLFFEDIGGVRTCYNIKT